MKTCLSLPIRFWRWGIMLYCFTLTVDPMCLDITGSAKVTQMMLSPDADVIVEGEYHTPAQEHAYLQPEAG